MDDIRPAKRDDLTAVRAIAVAAYTPLAARMPVPPAPLSADYASAIARARTWVACRDAAIAGYVIVETNTDFWIENIAVAPTMHGRGIGRQLMQHAETLATAAGYNRVGLYTPALIEENPRWYARLGYIETDRRVEEGRDRVYFDKRLRGDYAP